MHKYFCNHTNRLFLKKLHREIILILNNRVAGPIFGSFYKINTEETKGTLSPMITFSFSFKLMGAKQKVCLFVTNE